MLDRPPQPRSQGPLTLTDHLANQMAQAGCQPKLVAQFKKNFGQPNPNSLYAQNMAADLENHGFAPDIVQAHVNRMRDFQRSCGQVQQELQDDKLWTNHPEQRPLRARGLGLGKLNAVAQHDATVLAARSVQGAFTSRKALKNFRCTNKTMPTLAPEIAQLDRLKRLYIRNAGFCEMPPEIEDLNGTLEHVYLPGNGLTACPEPVFKLNQLKTLSLKNNGLTDMPDSVRHLQELEHLDLRFNQFKSVPPALFDLPETTIVDVSRNPLGEAAISAARQEIGRRQEAGLSSPKFIFKHSGRDALLRQRTQQAEYFQNRSLTLEEISNLDASPVMHETLVGGRYEHPGF